LDWYRLRGPETGNWAVAAEVTGVQGLNLALQLVDPEQSEALATANSTAQGGAEAIEPLVVSKRDVYLLLQEVREPGAPPGKFNKTPYKLVYHVYDASSFETEPNDVTASATPIELNKALNGRLDPEDKIDWYATAADTIVKTIQVSTAPGMDISLTLRSGPTGRESEVNQNGPGKGEGIALPPNPGPLRIGVHQIPVVDGGVNTLLEGRYQILIR
jgi:hypothetical protein